MERIFGCLSGLLLSGICFEIRGLFIFVWFIVFFYFFYYLIFMIILFFAGRFGEVELVVGILVILFVNVAGLFLFIGLFLVLEILGS